MSRYACLALITAILGFSCPTSAQANDTFLDKATYAAERVIYYILWPVEPLIERYTNSSINAHIELHANVELTLEKSEVPKEKRVELQAALFVHNTLIAKSRFQPLKVKWQVLFKLNKNRKTIILRAKKLGIQFAA